MNDSAWVSSINAVTLVTTDMARSCAFYADLGFEPNYGGPDHAFTSWCAGSSFVNVQLDRDWQAPERVWGRVILFVDDVDAVHRRACAAGRSPSTEPADAPWGERYFHISDPDGHELSFARPIPTAGAEGTPR